MAALRMHVRGYERHLMQYPEYKLHKVLLLSVPPALLALGTLGNALSFCVLMRKTMRRTSTYNYLAVLSVADTLVLYVGLLRLWLGEVTGWDVRDAGDWSCKLTTVLAYTVSLYSVWLLIAVTVERYIVTVHSLSTPTMCTRRRAAKIMGSILLLLLLINVHFLFTTQIRFYTDSENPAGNYTIPQCDGAVGHEVLVTAVWPWVDACLYSFLPLAVISVLNALIIHKVVLARRNRELLSGGATMRNGSLSSLPNSPPSSGAESSGRLTVMLLTVSGTFLVTTLPMNVVLIVTAFWTSAGPPDMELASRFRLARTVSELLMYTNHSANFYLYLLTGHKFREQLVLMFCPRRLRDPLILGGTGSIVSYAEHGSSSRAGSLRKGGSIKLGSLRRTREGQVQLVECNNGHRHVGVGNGTHV